MNANHDIIQSHEAALPGVLDAVREIVGDVDKEHTAMPDIASRTGIVSLDAILLGIPAGVTLIYGEPGSGKTALLGAIIAAGQKAGKCVALAQTEYFDGLYFENMDVNLKELPLIPFEDRSLFLEACIDFVSQDDAILAVDSITAFRPIEGESSSWYSLVYGFVANVQEARGEGSAIVLTSHVRAKRSVMKGKVFAGGTMSATRNLGRLVDLEIELSREGIKDDRYMMLVKVLASTISKPGVWATVPVVKGQGIDICKDLLDTALGLGVVHQRGAWYYLGDVGLGSGKMAAAKKLFNDRELMAQAIRSIYQ